MIKFFGKNNDLRTEEGKITKTGLIELIRQIASGEGLFVWKPTF